MERKSANSVIQKERALEIINRYPVSKILVIGDIMVDRFIWGRVSRISPEAPVPVVHVTSESSLLGGCANVLNNIFSMGGKTAVAGVIGSDEAGKWLIRQLREINVETEGVLVEKEHQTIVKTRIIAHGQQVVRIDREDKKPIPDTQTRKILDYIESIKHDLGAIVISDYNKGVISEKLIRGIRNMVSDRNVVLCIDPKQKFSTYSGCDLITPNHYEAERALGTELLNDDDIKKGGKALIDKFDFRGVLITRGEEGMVLFEKSGDRTPISAVAKEVYDVTGAGDTVIAILALSIAAGATFKEAAVLANHAAGIVVGKVGTATVSREELIRVL